MQYSDEQVEVVMRTTALAYREAIIRTFKELRWDERAIQEFTQVFNKHHIHITHSPTEVVKLVSSAAGMGATSFEAKETIDDTIKDITDFLEE